MENIPVSFPQFVESLDYSNIYSESAALNCAYVCGILQDVLGEEVLPTVSGRMSTSKFDFTIQDFNQQKIRINVENSQCEIDGGYEGISKLMLLEAKNFISHDFLIRQLYYPFRLWQGKIRKEVIPVFMTYSNDVFSFFKFAFEDVNSYNSLQLVEQRNYVIASEAIDINDIENIFDSVQIIKEPDVPFPQADKFERVVDLLGLLMSEGTISKELITSEYDFDIRQADYYANAGIYL